MIALDIDIENPNIKPFEHKCPVTSAQRAIEEIEFTNLLQTLVDFGNSKVYESFKLKLDLVDFRQKIEQRKKVQQQQQQPQQLPEFIGAYDLLLLEMQHRRKKGMQL